MGAGEVKGEERNILEKRWGRHPISNRRHGEKKERLAIDEAGVGRSINYGDEWSRKAEEEGVADPLICSPMRALTASSE